MLEMIRRIFKIAGRSQKKIVAGITFNILKSFFNGFMMFGVLWILLHLEKLTPTIILQALGVVVGSVIGRFFFQWMYDRTTSGTGYDIFRDYRLEIGEKLKQAPMGYFSEQNLGTIHTMLTTTIADLEGYSMLAIEQMTSGVAMAVLMSIMMFFFSPTIAILSIIGLLLGLLVLRWILAYAVELTGTEQEKIKGNLYELDYLQHFREVIEKSIPADNYTLIYEHGELTKPAGQYFDGDTDPQLGKFIRFEAQPNDPEALKSLLREQQKKRTPHTQRDFQLHIAALHDRQIETEARRIVENVKGLGEPDSPEKTHCAVELSPYFVPLATDKDMERLLSMLPYKSLSLSTLEGRHGVYALIDKSERKKEMKQSPPSVRAQLQTEKSPKVPKKTAKSKHHELEV
ncbi:ABC transporter transmembrane domain-containing protein [Gemmiger formicilis]|uniref:ABC transporter transmembrane domain-containing protein n=1 Tax=Gemmiger formicilis TaxID=745368 RepID=UPI003CE7FD00